MTTHHSAPPVVIPHEVNRLTIQVDAPYEEFRARYEAAVPPFAEDRFDRLVAQSADWSAVGEATRTNAPHDFIIYWSHDFSPLMRLAGHRLPCVEYLMGNHMIAERMYRHDPAVLLYAPLRTAIYRDAQDATTFVVDQPSTVFASFGNPAITEVGVDLDHELAALLEHLEVPVPAGLEGRES